MKNCPHQKKKKRLNQLVKKKKEWSPGIGTVLLTRDLDVISKAKREFRIYHVLYFSKNLNRISLPQNVNNNPSIRALTTKIQPSREKWKRPVRSPNTSIPSDYGSQESLVGRCDQIFVCFLNKAKRDFLELRHLF